MRPPLDGVVLITGASSGIGLALAKQMAAEARALVLVARRKDRLEALAHELKALKPSLAVQVVSCDLGDLEKTRVMLDELERDVGPIDVLVNNAGFGDLGVYDQSDWEKTRRMIDLNVTSLAFLTRRLVEPMVTRGRGGVLMISSGYGLTFTPGMAAYIATKHFVTGFTESLRLDLAGTGVVVTQSCPGPVATEFTDVAGNFTGMDVPKFIEISADDCARSSLKAFARGRAMIIPGFVIWLMMLLSQATPRFVLRILYAPLARALRKKQLAAPAAAP